MLRSYWWPGNIRELQNLVERLVATDERGFIAEEDLPLELQLVRLKAKSPSSEGRFADAVGAFERNLIVARPAGVRRQRLGGEPLPRRAAHHAQAQDPAARHPRAGADRPRRRPAAAAGRLDGTGRTTWPPNGPLRLGRQPCRFPNTRRYHDEEWGVPVHDDRVLFEFLILEGAQAGLSWATILRKRPYYRQAFAGFDPAAVARFTAKREAKLLADPGIVRNRLKVASTIPNAKAVLAVQDEFGSLDAYLWQFVGGEPRVNRWRSMREVPARTAESDAMSKALRKRGFRFVGSTICYAFMQAVGMVNDHTHRLLQASVTRVNLAVLPALIDWQPRTRLIFGPGVVARAGALAAELGLDDVLLVCDEGIVRAGYADTVQELLERERICVTRFSDFSENPDGDQVRGGRRDRQDRAASRASSPSAAAARSTAPRAPTSSRPTAARSPTSAATAASAARCCR